MSKQLPTLGRTVIYTLNAADAQAINDRAGAKNQAGPGQEYPAVVVRVWSGDLVNLQVHYDGDGCYWATSRNEGQEQGRWHWPERV